MTLHITTMRLFIVCMILLLIPSCTVKIDNTDYFPLDKGLEWKYRIVIQHSDHKKPIKKWFSIRNLGNQTITNGQKKFDTYVRRTSDGTDYYLIKSEEGLHRVAKRTVAELKPRFDEVFRKVLPNKNKLVVDALWNVETGLYVIHSLPEYEVDLSDKRLDMLFEIKSTNAVVDVPAGVFENCIEVEGYASITLYADSRVGFVEVPVIQREWYAPGVGLVKMTRTERIESTAYNGGALSFELSKFGS